MTAIGDDGTGTLSWRQHAPEGPAGEAMNSGRSAGGHRRSPIAHRAGWRRLPAPDCGDCFNKQVLQGIVRTLKA